MWFVTCLLFWPRVFEGSLQGILWPHVYLWGPEMGFGVWSTKKRFWGNL